MSLERNKRKIIAIIRNGRHVYYIYRNGKLMWQYITPTEDILSCIGNGYWVDEYPWVDDSPWVD